MQEELPPLPQLAALAVTEAHRLGIEAGRAEGFEKGLAIGAVVGAGLAFLVVVSCVWWLS